MRFVMSDFQSITPEEITKNPFSMIGKDWFLITAEDPNTGKVNTMTASWGCLGVLWNKPVLVCFIRPQRHTIEFVNTASRLSCSFLPEEYRTALRFCGTKSGRDHDKFAETGLSVLHDENNTPYVAESDLVILSRKLYVGSIEENEFLDPSLLSHYPQKDYHTVFVCEIESVLKKI